VKKSICLLMLLIVSFACNTTKNMTKEEIILINNGTKTKPYRVLLTDDKTDSLFLRQKAIDLDVKDIATNKHLQLFIERLKLTLAVESGVGIAAPQVGLGRNLFLFMRLDKPGIPVEVAINPRIVSHAEETVCFENDGCLSIPDIAGDTNRYPWIDVEYYNEKGELVRDRLSGHSRDGDFTGVIFQHEYDHLQGVLFTDRLCE